MLETMRLHLRPWEERDAESLYKYAKSPLVGPAAGWPMHTSTAMSREIIKTVFAAPQTYAVVLKETGEPVGSIGLMFDGQSHLPLKEDEAELGYWIGAPFWGKGLIPEAIRELLRHGFKELGLRAVWCAHFVENEKSRRVVEKCGFAYAYTLEQVVVAEDDVRTERVTCMTRERWMEFFR